MTKEELLQAADECFIDIEKSAAWQEMHTAKLLRAQLFMNEVDRRENDRVSERDFRMAKRSYKMEIWVIVLIGLELLSALVGLWYSVHEGNLQASILGHMDNSTAATSNTLKEQGGLLETMNTNTADTVTAMQKLQAQQNDSLVAQKNSLTTLRNTLKSIVQMDAALERQLNLAFEVSVLVTFNNDTKKIIVINQGKTAVLVWGAKSEQSPPVKFAQPRFVVPGAAYEFFLEEAFNRLSQTVPKGTQQDLPEDLYIKSADGKPYVVHDVLRALWEGDNFKIYSTTTAITQEEWPKEIQ
jgi:hypothetical protein